MSTTTTSTKVSATTRKLTKKATLKVMSSTQSVEEELTQQLTLTADSAKESDAPHKGKIVKKKATIGATNKTTVTAAMTTSEQQLSVAPVEVETAMNDGEFPNATKKKSKGKKSKKSGAEEQNISVKSSLNKFDALQKRNLIHVRSSDAGKAQEKFSNPQGEKEINCRLCAKPVYKMEEIKAEKSIFHRNCFRCHECNKPLKVDNYQSHEGVLYCTVHFKLLLAPKCVEESEPQKPSKPELIIRENQPTELPPDVVRASDKPDLGLEELQQLNVRSRFQVFENPARPESQNSDELQQQPRCAVKHSVSILSKLAKLQAQGVSTDLSNKTLAAQAHVVDSSDQEDDDDETPSDDDSTDNLDADSDLVRCKRNTKRERPVGLGHAMHDIKTKFEKGQHMSKEERREERKQEIQNIRSRLFMGKQARIKEMYQQAVAESEQAITASSKKPEIEIEGATRTLKERFENGKIFKDKNVHSDTEADGGHRTSAIQNEADVFESAISKESRNIFMELDANVVAGKNQVNAPQRSAPIKQRTHSFNRYNSENEPERSTTPHQQDVVKCDEKSEDVKIETSELSSKFKFFETYRPTERQKKEFRITPPREGVVKMPTPDSDTENNADHKKDDTTVLEKSHTTAMMLNKFRELERPKRNNDDSQMRPRPMKAFTPPPDGGKRVYLEQDSDISSQEDDEDDDEDEQDNDEDEQLYYRRLNTHMDDDALKEAQAAARAKQMRAKFEKWEANEKQRELNEGRVDIYSQQVSDDSNIESTKTIRERFENMEHSGKNRQPTGPRYKVNRFV